MVSASSGTVVNSNVGAQDSKDMTLISSGTTANSKEGAQDSKDMISASSGTTTNSNVGPKGSKEMISGSRKMISVSKEMIFVSIKRAGFSKKGISNKRQKTYPLSETYSINNCNTTYLKTNQNNSIH